MDILDAAEPAPDRTSRYAHHEDGVLDWHLPPAGDGPLLVLLHGGFWRTAYDRRHTRPMARRLAEAGFVVATPEYRRVGRGGSGGWPRTGDDVRTALAAALAETGQPGAVVTGHSAGGHLALWLTATDPAVTRAVPLAPVADIGEALRLGIGSHAARDFLGRADPEALDPMTLLAATPEPLPDVSIVHGTRDDVVPLELSRGLVRRYPWIRLVEPDADHFELIDPGAPAFASVVERLTA